MKGTCNIALLILNDMELCKAPFQGTTNPPGTRDHAIDTNELIDVRGVEVADGLPLLEGKRTDLAAGGGTGS